MEKLCKKESNTLYSDLFTNISHTKSVDEEDCNDSCTNIHCCYIMDDPNPDGINIKSDIVSQKYSAIAGDHFQRGKWARAIEYYDRSLCFAEIGSDQLCFTYASRSACFLKMKEYEKCIKDIELAFQSNCPEYMMAVLTHQKIQCMEFMKEYPKKRNELPLSFKESEKFPGMADVIEIQKNTEFGRHLVATCDIDVGEVILSEEYYVRAYAMAKESTALRCFNCMLPKNLIPCNECVDVMFCSDECRQRNKVHQICCGANFFNMPETIVFIIKTILTGLVAFNDANDFMAFAEDVLSNGKNQVPHAANTEKSKYAFFLSLQSAKKRMLDIEIVNKVFASLMDIPYVNAQFKTEESQRFLMHLVGEHFLILKNHADIFPDNPFKISLVPSLMNNSCAPNTECTVSPYNREICFALRPIKKGEQIFICYGIDRKINRPRRNQLLKRWDFLCECNKCVRQCTKSYRKEMQTDPNFEYILMSNLDNKSDPTIEEIQRVSEKCYNFLHKFGHLPWTYELGVISVLYAKCNIIYLNFGSINETPRTHNLFLN